MVAVKEANSNIDMDHLWVGERFAHSTEPKRTPMHNKYSFRKSIIPTKNIFQVGLHMSGACKLDYPWNGCDKNSTEFCTDQNKVVVGSLNTHHSFDEKVTDSNVKEIDTASEGVLYHVMVHRPYASASNKTDLSMKNDYAAKFFLRTLEALRKRRLDTLIETPGLASRSQPVTDSWVDYELVYATRDTLGTLFPGPGYIPPEVLPAAINF